MSCLAALTQCTSKLFLPGLCHLIDSFLTIFSYLCFHESKSLRKYRKYIGPLQQWDKNKVVVSKLFDLIPLSTLLLMSRFWQNNIRSILCLLIQLCRSDKLAASISNHLIYTSLIHKLTFCHSLSLWVSKIHCHKTIFL